MIDYQLLHKSILNYEGVGFERIETPWLVTEAVDSITRPVGVQPYRVEAKNKNLIASGEQGFLYLYLKEYLPKGKFQTVTPCFRNDSFDYTHTKYFMKNELIQTDKVDEKHLKLMLTCARTFFRSIFDDEIDVVQTSDFSYDLEWNKYELGSYGIRECDFLKWIYGTGCAEPRTSKLILMRNR